MKNNYSKETYEKIKKDNRKWLILSTLFLLIGLAFLGLSAFFINKNSVIIIIIIDSIILSLSLITSIYIFIELFLTTRLRYKFLYRLLTVERFEGTIKINKINPPYLVKRGVMAYEIEACDDDNKVLNCFYESINPLDFHVGDELEITLANNFIVDIKEKTK